MNSSHTPAPISQQDGYSPTLLLTILVVIMTSSLVLTSTWQDLIWLLRAPRYPTINPRGIFPGSEVARSFLKNSQVLLREGYEKFRGPFYLNTDIGSLLILPPTFIQSVAREKNLSFAEFIGVSFFSHLRTFQSFQNDPVLFSTISKLTQRLPHFLQPIASEASMFLDEKWHQDTEWYDQPCHEDMVQLIARASARCFVGEEAARDPEWIKIAIEHSANLQSAAEQLRRWPAPLRPIVERVAPKYRAVRAEHERAAELLAPFIKARQEELKAAAAEDRAPKVAQDFFEFARTTAKSGNYSDVNLQLGAAFSATQTTADILAQALLYLAERPEDQRVLREETIAVLEKHGMNKNALTEAHLMDSYIKETQRLKPSFIMSLQRHATADVVLPDGIQIPKGTSVAIPGWGMLDPANYDKPDEFDGARFARLRQQAGLENISQFVATNPKHTGFGHGPHACPGRFFASNTIKICMMHIVMKYDIRLENPEAKEPVVVGSFMVVNPKAKLSVRRRKAEIDLDRLGL